MAKTFYLACEIDINLTTNDVALIVLGLYDDLDLAKQRIEVFKTDKAYNKGVLEIKELVINEDIWRRLV